tara:strand:+ start:337 stop:618 length:282 start_codon:yes stop_codon:yes gene_type:complete
MLTDKQIRDAKPRTTVYRLRDTQSVCRGFSVVVAPSGSKSFFLSFTSPEDGKRKAEVVRLKACMSEASEAVLGDGKACRVDASIVRYPDRLMD